MNAPNTNHTTKIPVITLTRDDWAQLHRMHTAACQKLPGLTLDSVLSALITETLRHLRERPSLLERGL